MTENFWSQLSQETQNSLLKLGQLTDYTAQQLIDEEDALQASLNIVLKGKIQFSKTQPNGRIVKFAQILVGNIFGHATVFLGRPRAFKAVAIEKSQILRVSKSQTLEMFNHNPEFAMAIVKNLALIIEKRLLTITDEVTPKPLNLVVSALLEMQNTGKSEIKVTQSQLGHESGVSRLQAHRALKELQTQKIISLAYRAINVEDQSALEDLAVKQ